jgi:hypothetical protein
MSSWNPRYQDEIAAQIMTNAHLRKQGFTDGQQENKMHE